MKKTLLVLVLTVGTLVSKAQSLGTLGGLTVTKESKYYNTALWGTWVDFGKWGIQYSVSGSLNGSQTEIDNFINGKSKEFKNRLKVHQSSQSEKIKVKLIAI